VLPDVYITVFVAVFAEKNSKCPFGGMLSIKWFLSMMGSVSNKFSGEVISLGFTPWQLNKS
jgi:hypothetical protein